jgi:hypothetical protein
VAEDWSDFIERMWGIAMADLEKDGELTPVLFVDADGGPVAIPLPSFGPTSVERTEKMRWLGREFAKRHVARQATLIADAYVRRLQPGEDAAIKGSLADYPDAWHCLTMATRTADGGFSGRCYPYTREATLEGLKITFGEQEEEAGSSVLLDAFFATALKEPPGPGRTFFVKPSGRGGHHPGRGGRRR